MNRTNMLTALALGSVLRQAVAPEAGAEAAAPAAEGAKAQRAPASNFLPIVRGRLPLIFVHAVRFDKVINAMGNKDIAAKLATSVGKVFDIKKGRNFGYIGADFKPTAEDVSAAETWITQVGAENAKGVSAQGDVNLMKQIVEQYKSAGLATAEQAAAQSAARGASRAKVEGSAQTGGTAASPAAAPAPAAASNTADDLLG